MKSIVLSGLLALGLAGNAVENPVYKLFPQDILFHVSFDEGKAEPEMASGKAELLKTGKELVYGGGVFGGKALMGGRAFYSGLKNLDFSAPGTIVCWVSPVGWTEALNVKGKGRSYTAFQAYGDGYQFIMGKMGGQPKGVQHMNFYFYYPPSKAVSCVNFNTAGFKKPGEWKMLVATWDSGTFTTTVNTKQATAKKDVITTAPHRFAIGNSDDPKPEFPLLVDEVVILKRALSPKEINALYEESVKLIPVEKEEAGK